MLKSLSKWYPDKLKFLSMDFWKSYFGLEATNKCCAAEILTKSCTATTVGFQLIAVTGFVCSNDPLSCLFEWIFWHRFVFCPALHRQLHQSWYENHLFWYPSSGGEFAFAFAPTTILAEFCALCCSFSPLSIGWCAVWIQIPCAGAMYCEEYIYPLEMSSSKGRALKANRWCSEGQMR